jgi:hypothetical protein
VHDSYERDVRLVDAAQSNTTTAHVTLFTTCVRQFARPGTLRVRDTRAACSALDLRQLILPSGRERFEENAKPQRRWLSSVYDRFDDVGGRD